MSTRSCRRPAFAVAVSLSLVLAGCTPAAALTAGDIDAAARVSAAGLPRVTRSLASDRLRGRDNATRDSAHAQRYLLARLRRRAEGLKAGASGDARYTQSFALDGQAGTNLVGVIRGRERPDEYVLLGAHYDHLGTRSNAAGECAAAWDAGGAPCNGATDNAAGVAVVLGVARALRALPAPPRRSVVLALWDAEEDGLLGSRFYVGEPLVPLAQTIAYVNLDILGATLLPTLRDSTFAIAAESGGPALRALVGAAAAPQTLAVRPFTAVFGHLRSDHATFLGAGVPTVFVTDATGGCYHTTGDDADAVAFDKLAQQTAIVFRLVVALAEIDPPPAFVPPDGALATFTDAESLYAVLHTAFPADAELFSPADRAQIMAFSAQLDDIIVAGPAAFDDAAREVVLAAALSLNGMLADMGCRRF